MITVLLWFWVFLLVVNIGASGLVLGQSDARLEAAKLKVAAEPVVTLRRKAVAGIVINGVIAAILLTHLL